MDIKIRWDLLLNRMNTEAPTGMSRDTKKSRRGGSKINGDVVLQTVVLSCDGFEGVLTWCFFVLFVLTRRQSLRVESV